MPHKFIALGVGRGDAFYLKRNDVSVLVDGGQSKEGFAKQFTRTVGEEGVDYLVCTHNDADHANGVLGFLLRADLPCKEVWLPGSWSTRLSDILSRKGEFIGELLSDCEQIDNRKISIVNPLSTLGNYYSKEQSEQAQYSLDEETNGDFSDELISEIVATQDVVYDGPYSHLLYELPRPDWFFPLLTLALSGKKRQTLFLNAMNAAARIRAIALAAFNRSIPIRWFEYNNSVARRGKSGILEPVNSVEIVQLRKYKTALCYLSLTTANRESLVFQSPASSDFPGVLFLADSDLTFEQPLPQDIQLFTAPHHGSETNANAYGRVNSQCNTKEKEIWVRSDGRFESRPGKSYLSIKEKKFCTLCRGASWPKQDVELCVAKGKWIAPNTQQCVCR